MSLRLWTDLSPDETMEPAAVPNGGPGGAVR
jgi:hypothetical protein